MGEEALFEVVPHPLDRVELGRVGRQRHERDACRHPQRTRTMPSGLVEDQDDVLVLADRCGELIEELLHRLGVGVRQHEREGVVGSWLDGCEDVGEREALVAEPRRTLASPPPDVARAPLLPDAGLVLEEEADALVFMRTLYFSEQRWGSF